MKLFVLVVMLMAPIGGEPRYSFFDGRTSFEIPRFNTMNDCQRAANDITEPLQRAGFRISFKCEASQ